MYRVSLGLVSLLLSILLLARNFDLLPDPDAAAVARRQAACESVAIACSLAANRNESLAGAAPFVRTLARRTPDLLSVGVRDTAGKLVIDSNEHDGHWGGYDSDRSTPTHLHAAVYRDAVPWGRVELAFRPLPYGGGWRFVGGGLAPLFAFVLAGSFVVTALYLRAVFRRVDMAQARVVPDRVRATLNTLAEGVLVLDADGVIALANDAFARSAGVAPEALRGRKVSDLPWHAGTVELKPDDHPWVRVIREAAPQMGRVLGLRAAGDGKTLSVNATPIFGENGKCKGALATFDDLTPVEKARAAAEAASKAKGEFLANVSHEIRTPMNAIMGMTELVLEGGRLTPEQRDCLGIVGESATSLLGIINDLLDLSKIESGKMDLDPVDFDVRSVLEDTLQGLSVRAHAKGLEVACDVDRDVPDVLVGDSHRLRQIVVNLVGNAIKFTDRGHVVLRARVDHRERRQAQVHFLVEDTGIGIPANKLQAIFEPFIQADGSTTRKFGGTGLGLTISSHLATLMGGAVWAESTVGGGSTFHVTAWFGTPTHSTACLALPDVAALEGLSVLVADDHPAARAVLADLLDQVGLRPVVVDGAEAALAALERAAALHDPFPLLIADATLPEDDGFTLVEAAVRRQLVGAAVMLLPADKLTRDGERARQAGAAAHLRKPVKRAELYQALRKAADPAYVSQRMAPPDLDPPPAAGPPGLRVLVVEDNPFNQKVAAMKLGRWGHRVRVVGTGREALAALAEDAYDLMFTDIQMPDMDGYQLTATVRCQEAQGKDRIPIVAMTAHAMKGVSERCLQAGMDDYVSKPIRDEDLQAAIARCLPAGLSAAQETRSHRQDTGWQTPPPVSPFADDAVLARVGGNREVLRGLIQVFYKDCNALMHSLKVAIKAGDAREVRAAAHTIKGMVAFFEASAATEMASRLEQAGVRGELDEAQPMFAALARELTNIEAGLTAYSPASLDGWHLGLADRVEADVFSPAGA